jgi:ubiquinone/menaquinone biosynthesis C-methylase UbiE
LDIKEKQVAYHDWESATYDNKWSISFDKRCIDYAVGRFRRAVPDVPRFDRVLEIGCGTGFFLLNLVQAGIVGEAHATDIAPGMVEACIRNGRRLGVEVHGRVADAEALPYPDGSFDAVIGHAVVHHVPDLDTSFKEMLRVLRPGGRLVLAGEPTRTGDRIAGVFKRAARAGVLAAAAVAGRERILAERGHHDHAAALEAEVDLHTFTSSELEALARQAGFLGVQTFTEELTANWFGWTTRTVEALVRPEALPAAYPWFAYRTWRALYALDEVARRVVPKDWFYNCILTGRSAGRAGVLGPPVDIRVQ